MVTSACSTSLCIVSPFRTGHISLSVLERLQITAGIDIINQLAPRYRDFIRVVPKEVNLEDHQHTPTEVCKAVFGKCNLTWGVLLIALRALSMNELTLKIEEFFKTRSTRSPIAGGILSVEDLEESDEQSEEEEEEDEEEDEEDEEGWEAPWEEPWEEQYEEYGVGGWEEEWKDSEEEEDESEEEDDGEEEDIDEWLKDCESTVQSLMELRLKDQQQIETLPEADKLKKQLGLGENLI